MNPIRRYNLTLRPMLESDLELVRQWRNSDHVRRQMEYQEFITWQMQQEWWQQLDPASNYYYIIHHNHQDIGLIHAKNIDWDSKTAETGIFIGEPSYLGTQIPVLAVLAMMDELVEIAGMQILCAKVKATEKRTLDFNRRLGYEPVPGTKKQGFITLKLSRHRYLEATAELREMAKRHCAKNF